MGCGCNGGGLNYNYANLPSYEWDWTSFAAGIVGGVLILALGIYGTGKYIWPAMKGKQNG